MPHLTIALDPTGGPVLPVGVAVSQARREALAAAGQDAPAAVSIRALIDTGASCTCVDPSVLQALHLPPTGSVAVHTPSTGAALHQAQQYDVRIIIPGAGTHHLPLTLDAVPVISVDLAVQGIHALIGRDVLQDCILIFNGAVGEFTIAF